MAKMENKSVMSDSCVSAVKFTADGQMSTKTMCMIADRHLNANLELPNLEERCGIPSDKNLYKLSQELASSEAENNSDENELDLPKAKIQNYENNVQKYENNLGATRSARAQNYNIGYKMPKDIPVQSAKRKRKKYLRVRYENKKFSNYSSDESYDNAPRSRKNSTANGNETQTLQLLDDSDQLQPSNESEDITTIPSSETSVTGNTSSNKLIRGIEVVSKVIDVWYYLTPLLLLGIVFYLIYILFFDINIHVNEELRYYRKIRSAPLVLKWFYYVMRLLNVPMF